MPCVHLVATSTTIRRRNRQCGIEEEAGFTDISDVQLNHIAHHFVTHHPNCGERSFHGYLRLMGLCVIVVLEIVFQQLIQGELGVISGEHFIEECIQSLCQTASCGILMGTINLSGGV